jgi:Flp pilus assembly protein TadG
MRVRMAPFPQRFHEDQSGASAVEFAVVFPVFLLIVIGIFVYAIYFGAVHSVQQLAAEAARASVAGISPAERSDLARGHVARAAPGYPFLDRRRLTVQAGVSLLDPNLFEVEIAYDASDLVIFAFAGLLPMPPKLVRRQAVVRRGGY